MRLAELFPDGTVRPLDVVANYGRDIERWGEKVARANAVSVLDMLTGRDPPPNRLDVMHQQLRDDPDYWKREQAASVLVRLPEDTEE